MPDLGQNDSNVIRYEDQEVRRSNTEAKGLTPAKRKEKREQCCLCITELYTKPKIDALCIDRLESFIIKLSLSNK
jgi:hypothetical protein